jgi:hypothetical protein
MGKIQALARSSDERNSLVAFSVPHIITLLILLILASWNLLMRAGIT